MTDILLLLGMAVLTGAELLPGNVANAVRIVVSVGCLIVSVMAIVKIAGGTSRK